MRWAIALPLLAVAAAEAAQAQAVPDGSQAVKVEPAYRRTPTFRNDPFRHVFIPHWGFVFSLGAMAENNTLNVADVRAVLFLEDKDSLLAGDLLDLIGLVPTGVGIDGLVQGEGGFYLGGPFGRRVSIGVSAQGRAYGSFLLDDDAVALLRDGNTGRTSFSLGNTQFTGLSTAEAGAHAMIRLGSREATEVTLGFGGRYIRPVVYGDSRSIVANGGSITVTGTNVAANIEVASQFTPDVGETFSGSGIAADLLLRLEWPRSGLALEAMVANLGKLTIPGVERRELRFNVSTTRIDEVTDSLDVADFVITDTTEVDVTLPRIVRFTASAWANRILQIDVSTTLPVEGDFRTPMVVDLGTTWRFVRVLPLRVGVALGGPQKIGYTGGLSVEGRTMFLQLHAQSLGGLFRKATGTGARLELGFFF